MSGRNERRGGDKIVEERRKREGKGAKREGGGDRKGEEKKVGDRG